MTPESDAVRARLMSLTLAGMRLTVRGGRLFASGVLDEHEERWVRENRAAIVGLLSEPAEPKPVKEEAAPAAKEKQQETQPVAEPEPEVWYRGERITARHVDRMLDGAPDDLREQYRRGALTRASAYAMARRWLRQRAQLGLDRPPTRARVPRWS